MKNILGKFNNTLMKKSASVAYLRATLTLWCMNMTIWGELIP